MSKRIGLLIILVVLPFVMAACGGDDVSADDAENAIKAAFEGNVDEANKYLCDDQKMTEEDAEAVQGLIELGDISCEKDGDNMKCEVTMSAVGVENSETTQEFNIKIEDGKLCGEMTPAGE